MVSVLQVIRGSALGLFRTASRNPALAMRPVNYARLLRPAVSITYYLNGHHFIERELQRVAVAFRKDDNALLWVADAQALQAAAHRLRSQIIR